MDSTCVLIGQRVCFHSAMNYENDVSNMVGCLQVVKIWNFTKETKLYKRASEIVFLFVMMQNNNLIKEIQHVLRAFIAWWKPLQSVWEFSTRWKPLTASRVFTDLLSNFLKCSRRFSTAYEDTENMFYFLKIRFQIIITIPESHWFHTSSCQGTFAMVRFDAFESPQYVTP